MRRESHVRFCEGVEVRSLRATRRNVYMQSRREGERLMQLLRKLFTGLKLRINESKSAIDLAQRRKILGYSFWVATGQVVKRRVSKKAIKAMQDRVREITKRNRGRSIGQVVAELRSYLAGWKEYCRLADTPKIFRELDEWIRHPLRALHLKRRKSGPTIYRELRARGMSDCLAAQAAAAGRCWWHISTTAVSPALPNTYFDQLQLPRLAG